MLEEEEEDYHLFDNILNKKRKPIDNMYLSREDEGFFNVLINKHLSKIK